MNIITSNLSKKECPRYLRDEISDNIPRARRKMQKKQKQKMKNIANQSSGIFNIKRPNPEISEEF